MHWRTAKDWWVAKRGRWREVALYFNLVGSWLRHLEVEPPLQMTINEKSCRIHLNTQGLLHPFKITVDNSTGSWKWSVAAGRVNADTLGYWDVAAREDVALGVSLKIWLRVQYFNDHAADPAFEICDSSVWENMSYSADTADETGVGDSGWVMEIIRLGEIDMSSGRPAITQYIAEDVLLPFGLTYIRPVVLHTRYEEADFVLTKLDETYVRGSLISLGEPYEETVFTSGPCPESDEGEG